MRSSCRERRAHRWMARPAGGRLADRAPGGSPMHGLLAEEAEAILALYDEWGETDRSHRKLAHRGSYLHRVWVSPSSVRRVLFLADKHFRPLPRPGSSVRRPFPDLVDRRPNSIWIYDTTHFPAARMAVLIIEDLVPRKWLTEVVSVEETSTQVELAFTDALAAEGLLEHVQARRDDGRVDLGVDDESRPRCTTMRRRPDQYFGRHCTRPFAALVPDRDSGRDTGRDADPRSTDAAGGTVGRSGGHTAPAPREAQDEHHNAGISSASRIGAAAGIAGFGFVFSYFLVLLVLQRNLADNPTLAQIRAHLVDDRNLISLGALFTEDAT